VPFQPRITVTSEFLDRVVRIRELDFELDRFVLSEKDYSDLVLDAYAANIHWSTKLEGNPLSEEEVRRITRSTFLGEVSEHPNGPVQEIINHVLFYALEERMSQDWDEAWICTLHEMLLSGTGTSSAIGAFRKTEAIVHENDRERTEVFRPCPAPHVREEMASLLEWMRLSAPAYDPIVSAAVFFHEFESIHPFEDGNGRLGRSLFHIYLMNHGLKKSPLCKIDAELLQHSDIYYNVLAYTDESGDYAPLIEMFSIAVLRSYEDAVESLGSKNLLSSELDENSKRLIIMAKRCKAWFSVREATAWVDGVGEQTVRNRLQELVALGVLTSQGRTKGMRFRFKVPFQNLRDELNEMMKADERSP
jgi:Fic family protein